MPLAGRPLAGVDVGARRKGFHVALLEGSRLLDAPRRLPTPEAVVGYLTSHRPVCVAVDSPIAPARDGERSRSDERRLMAAKVCNIRWTPERRQLDGRPYYEWIRHGLQLYEALQHAGLHAIECFPTASFTRWHGRRDRRSRAAWSREALRQLGLDSTPARSSQDDRDAIAAAVTAWQHMRGETEAFGAIIVPTVLPHWTARL